MKKVAINLLPLLPLDRVSTTLIAQTASHFESRLTIEQKGVILNLKSMLGLLSQPDFGDGNVFLVADGKDEDEAIEVLLSIFQK